MDAEEFQIFEKEIFQELIYTYVIFSALTFYLHDYLTTFTREIHFVWKSRFSFGTLLYLLSRVALGLCLAGEVCMVLWFNIPVATCTILRKVSESSLVISQISVEIMIIMRAYAISHSNAYVLVGLSLLGLGAVVPAWIVVVDHSCSLSLSKDIVIGTRTWYY